MDTSIEYIDKGSNKTLVSFTALYNDHSTTKDFRKDFKGLLKQSIFNVMFVADREMSWYNTVDVDKIKSKLNNQEVITIGSSMGAYNAIQFANDFNVTKVIAFATQYSIHPHIVPDQRIWEKHSDKIKKWNNQHLVFNNTTEYYIFSGDKKEEMYHTNMIPYQRNIHKFTLIGGHYLANRLKAKGILYLLINDCINYSAKIVALKYAKYIKCFDVSNFRKR